MVAPLAILGWTLLGGGAVAGASALSDSAGEAVEGAAEAAVEGIGIGAVAAARGFTSALRTEFEENGVQMVAVLIVAVLAYSAFLTIRSGLSMRQ